MNKKKFESYINLSLCILLWASIPVASKKILVEISNIQMLFYSTVLSFIVMGCILLFQKKIEVMRSYTFKDYLVMGFLGFLGAYLYYVLLYGAFALTSASEGFILAYTWPILVLILAFLILKEKVTLKKIISILISFFGIVVIVSHGKITSIAFTNLTGDILALSGAFIFALFSILGKKYNFDKTVSAFIYFCSALIFIILTVFFTSSLKLPSINVWLWLIYNGIFVNGITYIFWFKALEHGDTEIISNVLYLTPFLSLIYIYLFLNEKILLSSVFGLIIIVSGILIQSFKKKSGSTLIL
jgi:drug/metabolite transporter (DMT)-like permease